jgi:acyl carrier protein
MYATGDRARHLPDGRIEFLGRTDHQVKLRGFRIELEEVEAALRDHSAIRDVAVGVQNDSAGGRLTAWTVRNGHDISTEELRRFAASILPGHMVPSAIVWLDALPRTPNGKLNRTALGNMAPPAATEGFAAPETEAEAAVALIWADILGLERVGIHDNFFDIGGHSLLAVRLVSRLRHDLSIELPLREVFLHPTVSALASVVEEKLIEEIEQLSEDDVLRRLETATE